MRIISLLFLSLFLAACTMGTIERDRLPEGVTLLKSMTENCGSTLYIEDAVAVETGESSVFELEEYRDIDWECLEDPAADKVRFRCPAGTDYLRVIRQEDEDEFTVECFG